jgi:putative FmdB family regulatory protein
MIFYDYKCEKCGHTFTERHNLNERLIPTENPCPNCQEENCIQIAIGPIKSVWKCSLPTNS